MQKSVFLIRILYKTCEGDISVEWVVLNIVEDTQAYFPHTFLRQSISVKILKLIFGRLLANIAVKFSNFLTNTSFAYMLTQTMGTHGVPTLLYIWSN